MPKKNPKCEKIHDIKHVLNKYLVSKETVAMVTNSTLSGPQLYLLQLSPRTPTLQKHWPW